MLEAFLMLSIPYISSLSAALLVVAGYKLEILRGRPEDPGKDVVTFRSAQGLAFSTLLFMLLTLPEVSGMPTGYLYAIVSLLIASAWLDAASKWSPDMVLLPLLIVASLSGPLQSQDPSLIDITYAIFGAASVLAIASLLWMIQLRINMIALPPPDIIAVSLPIFIFGISFLTVSVYLFMAVVLLVALRTSPNIAPESVSDDLPGLRGRPVVPVLPVTNVAILFGIVYQVASSGGMASTILAKMLQAV